VSQPASSSSSSSSTCRNPRAVVNIVAMGVSTDGRSVRAVYGVLCMVC
jgi:hypothetical protein